MTRQVRLEALNTRDFQAGGFTTAILPIGACESHGDHMPFGTDALTAHALALRVAERLTATVVAPPLNFGMSDHYRHKPICLSLSSDTVVRVIRDLLLSFHHWGIERVLILNGHDGNIPCAEIAAREVKVAHPAMSLAVFDWWVIVPKFLPPETFEVWNGWGHAGEVESSVGLALFPELMHMQHARGMVPKTDPFVKEIWTFDELTAHGATGGPARATPEKGAKVVGAVIDYLAEYMARFEREGLRHDPQEP
ncbi:creatininase family protein [Roseomonas sp. OT10]|uniref:creatininase family protein n=1 Tax=Roseomonas cutis TaxID=2897332 RepID=UPI001E33B21E|nr:creatininase family protein [Roseomonas sp. OT10]UFN47290.1 creatininase family protein [Roseomonas sp. OT10]